MKKNAKIYVAGHSGLVGSAICNNLIARGYTNIIGKNHSELDLMNSLEVSNFFKVERPDYVLLAAAHVGGIVANNKYRADFIYRNLQIQNNVIGESWRCGVKKLLFLGSTCIYPKDAPQPMSEDMLLTASLEYTNEPYAIAKIAGLKMCESFNLQYGTNFISVMPTNLYGPNDNFHLENSHVIPAMMRKIYLARLIQQLDWARIRRDLNVRPIQGINGSSSETEILEVLAKYGIENNKVTLWGTGTPLREFLWSEDMADASVHILLNVDFCDITGIEKYSSVHYGTHEGGDVVCNHSNERGGAIASLGEIRNCHINIGSGKELTIRELADLIVKTVGFEGTVTFDASKPDGSMRKLVDVSKLHSLGWTHKVEIDEGVRKLFEWYKTSII